MPGIVMGALHVLPHLILMTQRTLCYFNLHLINKVTGAQLGYVACLGSPSKFRVEVLTQVTWLQSLSPKGYGLVFE